MPCTYWSRDNIECQNCSRERRELQPYVAEMLVIQLPERRGVAGRLQVTADYCIGRGEYSYKTECNVSGGEVGHGDSINIMGPLERRAVVSHKQDTYCAIVLRHNVFSANKTYHDSQD